MDITSIVNTANAGRVLSARATDKVTGAFREADKRIQQQRDATSVQLSSFGKLQSAVADTQTAARTLSDAKQVNTDAGVRKAASTFVDSFNSAIKAARANIPAQTSAREGANAKKAEGELRTGVNKEPVAVANLQAIGITQQKDGSLAIDTKKFDAALQSDATTVRTALDTLGQQVDKAATRQLASGGTIGGSVSALNARASRLESQQSEQQSRAAAVQQAISQRNTQLTASQSATEVYQRIFSL